MSLPQEIVAEIDAQVRSGFEDRDRIIQIFSEERYEPGELDLAEIEAAVDQSIAELEAQKKTWPQVTDCDRLDAFFEAIAERGIIGLQNAGYTQSDGYSDIREAYESSPNAANVIGYCFYHGQDLERAVDGDGLYLAFGPIDPKTERTEGPKIGRIIVEELQCVGFKVLWNGTFQQRICIADLDWKKR